MTTTENIRADALTRLQREAIRSGIAALEKLGWTDASEVLRNMLAASPVEQPAAAPIAVAYACLTPSGKVAFFDGKPMLSTVQNECFPVALGVITQPAPSPADERAAFAYAVPVELEHMEKGYRNSMVVCRRNEGAYSVPIYREGVAQARAASASEAVAVGAIYQCMGTDDDAAEHDQHARDLWMDVPRDAYEKLSKRPDVRSRIAYAAPQPAQADARAGLIDARIARLRAAIEGECDGLNVDYHHAKAILAHLDDDRA